MRSTDLTQWQRSALKNKVRPMSEYLTKLRKRMTSRGFRDDDPLLIATLKAERAAHALYAQTQLLANPGPKGSA
jgi:hypothetical protein